MAVGATQQKGSSAGLPDSGTERDVLVRAVRLESEGVLSFVLEACDGQPLPAFEPGAHIDLHLPMGVRQYSLINDGRAGVYEIAVGLDRAGRGGSAWLHKELRPGMVLKASPPRNTFPLDDAAPYTALFAGGVGVTPIRAMAVRLAALGRPFSLLYAARSKASAAFAAELAGLKGARLHFDAEAGGPADLAAAIAAVPAGAKLYCCGPTSMIEAFTAATAGRPAELVSVERFGAAPIQGEAGSFVVELARSGRSIEVGPTETILDALATAGIAAPSSCRNGVCGTCETTVLAGQPDHRDMILSEAERAAGGSMMICCSRAKSPRLTLDL